jgi:hypothetical protein
LQDARRCRVRPRPWFEFIAAGIEAGTIEIAMTATRKSPARPETCSAHSRRRINAPRPGSIGRMTTTAIVAKPLPQPTRMSSDQAADESRAKDQEINSATGTPPTEGTQPASDYDAVPDVGQPTRQRLSSSLSRKLACGQPCCRVPEGGGASGARADGRTWRTATYRPGGRPPTLGAPWCRVYAHDQVSR